MTSTADEPEQPAPDDSAEWELAGLRAENATAAQTAHAGFVSQRVHHRHLRIGV